MNSITAQTAQIAAPAPLYTRDSSASYESPNTGLHVFGYTFTPSAATSASRHDHRFSAGSTSELPPSYLESHSNIVPGYTATHEPVTLAMYLFRFGFLFPPFWLMGTFILFSPLRDPPTRPSLDEDSIINSWLPEKTRAEKEAFISHMRKAELKWAKRCLIAFVLLAVIVGIAVGLAVLG